MAKRTSKSSADLIPYTPGEWTDGQRACHVADSMDEALVAASILTGWYQRAVTIDYIIDGDKEHYMLRPLEVAPLAGWQPCYAISKAVA